MVKLGREIFGGQVTVDFGAAASVLEAGVLSCSVGQGRVLRIAASIAEGVPVDLREAVTGLDASNAVLAAGAVLHAAADRDLGARLACRGWPAVSTVRLTRPRQPLDGRELRALGSVRRHGEAELLLVVLPDGSKRRTPAAWADLERPADGTGAGDGSATRGSV